MAMNASEELTVEQAQLLLNDHVGDRVAVELHRPITSDDPPILKIVGELQAWGTEFGASDDPSERDELSAVYMLGAGEYMLDLTQFRTAPAPIRGAPGWGLAFMLEGGVLLSVSWRDLPGGDA